MAQGTQAAQVILLTPAHRHTLAMRLFLLIFKSTMVLRGFVDGLASICPSKVIVSVLS